MTSSRSIEVAPSARLDITRIWRYTLEAWDDEQADAYANDLETGIKTLADFPDLGQVVSTKRPGLRRSRIREHLVLYQTTATKVTVLRVVHARMDVSRVALDE